MPSFGCPSVQHTFRLIQKTQHLLLTIYIGINMLNEHNINNGDDYANLLIKDMEMFMSEGMPADMIEYWSKEVRQLCNIKYLKYIEGSEESFMLTDVELEDTYKIAIEKLIGDTLGSLVDKGMAKMSVDVNGEVRYQATEQGLKQVK